MKEKTYLFVSYIVASPSENLTIYGDKCFLVENGEKVTIKDIREDISISESEKRPWIDAADWSTPCITNIQVLDNEIAEMLYDL